MSLVTDLFGHSPVLTAFICTIVVTILYLAVKRWRSFRAFLREFEGAPTPDYHWLWGHLLAHPGPNEKGLAYDLKNTERFGKYFIIYFGRWHPTVQIVHPDAARELLQQDTAKAHRMCGMYSLVVPWVGWGILTNTGEIWKRNRRLLTPAFHYDILQPYIEIKNDSIGYLISKWRRECGPSGATVEVSQPFSELALETMMRCALNYHVRIQGTKHEYIKALSYFGAELFRRIFSLFLKFNFIYFKTPAGRKFKKYMDYVHKFAEKLISDRRAEIKVSGENPTKRHVDFLDILILAKDDNGVGLTDKEIRQEMDTLLFAGHGTTKAAMSWLIYNLAIYPESQRKAYEEVAALFKGETDPQVKLEDLNNIPYLTLCIKESMRLMTTVFVTGRDLDEPTDIGGRVFPKGTQVVFQWYSYHHNPLIWGDDHMEFKPERFLHENVKDMDPFAYAPFAAGPRNCIGQKFALHEMKILAIRMLLAFEMSADNKQHHKINTDATLQPADGLFINLIPRQ